MPRNETGLNSNILKFSVLYKNFGTYELLNITNIIIEGLIFNIQCYFIFIG